MARQMVLEGLKLAIYDYIKDYIAQNGYSPTYTEIKADLQISSKSVIKYHIDTLCELDLLEVASKIPRGIVSIAGIESGEKTKTLAPIIERKTRRGSVIRKYKMGLPIVLRRVMTAQYVKVPAVTYFGGCAYCGERGMRIEMDHFLPLNLGGIDAPENLVPACVKCNRDKSDKEPVKWVLENFSPEVLSTIIAYTHGVYIKKD